MASASNSLVEPMSQLAKSLGLQRVTSMDFHFGFRDRELPRLTVEMVLNAQQAQELQTCVEHYELRKLPPTQPPDLPRDNNGQWRDYDIISEFNQWFESRRRKHFGFDSLDDKLIFGILDR